jgi:hypothetical protein
MLVGAFSRLRYGSYAHRAGFGVLAGVNGDNGEMIVG